MTVLEYDNIFVNIIRKEKGQKTSQTRKLVGSEEEWSEKNNEINKAVLTRCNWHVITHELHHSLLRDCIPQTRRPFIVTYKLLWIIKRLQRVSRNVSRDFYLFEFYSSFSSYFIQFTHTHVTRRRSLLAIVVVVIVAVVVRSLFLEIQPAARHWALGLDVASSSQRGTYPRASNRWEKVSREGERRKYARIHGSERRRNIFSLFSYRRAGLLPTASLASSQSLRALRKHIAYKNYFFTKKVKGTRKLPRSLFF